MGRFGFGKKGGDDDNESKKSSLFGSRSKQKSETITPPSHNPYARAAAPSDPYTQAKVNVGLIPGQQPAPSATGHQPAQSSFQPQHGYAPNRYAEQSGYGGSGPVGNPYAASSQGGFQARSGGYGGLGPTKHVVEESDGSGGDLFGAAAQRNPPNAAMAQTGPPAYRYEGASDPSESRSYGASGDRQLTAEEEENQDIEALKQQIRETKQSTHDSSSRTADLAESLVSKASDTGVILGAQGETFYNTEKNLDLAQNQVTAAEDKTEELRRLNRSMFIPAHNPFTSKSRAEKQEQRIIDNHHDERLRREEIREQSYRQNQRMQDTYKQLDRVSAQQPGGGYKQRNLAERGKYQFEADEEDDAMEDRIDHNLERIGVATSKLKAISYAYETEIDHQNRVIKKIAAKSDAVDDRVITQTARLKRIK